MAAQECFNTDIYVAFQLQKSSADPANDGWIESGRRFGNAAVQGGKDPATKTDRSIDPSTGDIVETSVVTEYTNKNAILPISSQKNFVDVAPTTQTAYSTARTFEVNVKQDYPVPGSTGGPQPAGRPDFGLAVFTRDCDLISPYLFQYGASGWLIPKIYVIRYIGIPDTLEFFLHEWSLREGLVVAEYNFSHGRTYNECLDRTDLNSRETVKIVYTDIQYRCSRVPKASDVTSITLGGWKGWKTGTEEIIN